MTSAALPPRRHHDLAARQRSVALWSVRTLQLFRRGLFGLTLPVRPAAVRVPRNFAEAPRATNDVPTSERSSTTTGRTALFTYQSDGTPEEIPTHLQLRVLPAQDARGNREAARDAAPACATEPEVLLGHLRRGGLHPRSNSRDRTRDPARRLSRRAAPVLHRLDPRRDRCYARTLQGQRHPPRRGAAWRSAFRFRGVRRAALRKRAGGVHPRENGRLVHHRGRPAIRRCIPRRAARRTTCETSSAK